MKKEFRFVPDLTPEQIREKQLEGLKWTVKHAYDGSEFYRAKLKDAGVDPDGIKSLDDITSLPFTTAEDLKAGYPLPLLSVPEQDVVRIHASSGTTGKRKVLSYTQKDIDTWKDMFARCYEVAGCELTDRVQICVGYGLWTAGVGFQLGAERFGAMALPIGPGLLDIQMQLLADLGTTVLGCTASMALLMGEEVEKAGIRDQLKLRKVIFGAETHTPKMRSRFEKSLGVEHSHDISGMTELYGPGAGIECEAHTGIHYWADQYILELIDPETLKPIEPGQSGEMVVTTLSKEASPLIRYRTRDMTRFLPGECPCGCNMPRHDKISGRSDDMFIFRGVNIYPGQFASVFEKFPELSSEYQIQLTRRQGLDYMSVRVEKKQAASIGDMDNLSKAISEEIRRYILVRSSVDIVNHAELPRTFGKTKRVMDDRDQD